MNDREIKGIGILLGVGLLGFAILSHTYQAGVAAGLARGGNGTAVGPVDGVGFFPFPPLLLLLGGGLLFVAWRRRWAGDGAGSHGRGPGGGRPPRLFEEWHRRAHEGDAPQAPVPGSRPEGSPEPGPTEGGSV